MPHGELATGHNFMRENGRWSLLLTPPPYAAAGWNGYAAAAAMMG